MELGWDQKGTFDKSVKSRFFYQSVFAADDELGSRGRGCAGHPGTGFESRSSDKMEKERENGASSRRLWVRVCVWVEGRKSPLSNPDQAELRGSSTVSYYTADRVHVPVADVHPGDVVEAAHRPQVEGHQTQSGPR